MIAPEPVADASAVDEQVSRLIAWPKLRDAPRLRSLLELVVALAVSGKAAEIKESTIAREVFARDDTTGDSIVRSAAGRLRARLDEYYASEGAEDPIRISIPKGSYVPLIRSHHPTVARPCTPPARSGLWPVLILAVLTAVAAALGVLHRPISANSQGPIDAGARDLYFQGRYYWTKRTPDDLRRAIAFFKQSAIRDPHYAEAYIGLADAYNLLNEYDAASSRDSFWRAAMAARTALALNPDSAPAHGALAFASFYGFWDAAAAEREFRRALSLDPSSATGHHWYATFLMSLGRSGEAISEITRAQELDPAMRAILADKGMILFNAGAVTPAQALLEQLAVSDPQFVSPHRYLATLYVTQHRFADALHELKKKASLSNDTDGWRIAQAGETALTEGGPFAMVSAMRHARQSAATAEGGYLIAQIYVLLGDSRDAIDMLQSAYGSRDPNLLTVAADRCFRPLHDVKAFQALLRQIRPQSMTEPSNLPLAHTSLLDSRSGLPGTLASSESNFN